MSDSWKNKAGLTADSISLLAEDFKVLEKLNPDLPSRLMRYLLDDEDPSVLVTLSNTQDASEVLGLLRGYGSLAKLDGQARAEFYRNLKCVDEKFFIRLGKTYAAAGRAPSKVAAQFGPSAPAIFFPPLGFGDNTAAKAQNRNSIFTKNMGASPLCGWINLMGERFSFFSR